MQRAQQTQPKIVKCVSKDSEKKWIVIHCDVVRAKVLRIRRYTNGKNNHKNVRMRLRTHFCFGFEKM